MDMPINMRLECFANNSMSFIQSGDKQHPEHKSSHTSLVIVDIVKLKKSEIVSINKYSIDPISSRLNDAADRVLLQRLSCIIKKAMRYGKFRYQYSYSNEFNPFKLDALCIISSLYHQATLLSTRWLWSCWIHCLAVALIMI